MINLNLKPGESIERIGDVVVDKRYTIGRGIKDIGEAIAFSTLVIACTYMEVSPECVAGAGKLWILVVIWGVCF